MEQHAAAERRFWQKAVSQERKQENTVVHCEAAALEWLGAASAT